MFSTYFGGREKKKEEEETIVKTTTIGLIHATWCGHCTNLMPHFDEAKEHLEKNHPDIKVIKMEENEATPENIASTHKDLKLKGFPTLFKVIDGVLSEFSQEDGNRNSAESLIKWATKEKKQKGGNPKTKRKATKRKAKKGKRKSSKKLK